MSERKIIMAAKVLSVCFNPFYLPVFGLAMLFMFSSMKHMPAIYIAKIMVMVYLCTVLLPTLLIRRYRRYQGWSLWELGLRERRIVPYAIAIMCYCLCFYMMNMGRVPHFMISIVVAALVIQVVCAIINLFWKISTHTAALGGVAGALLVFSAILRFNPVWWLCVIILLGGMLGTSRMILRQHSLSQVVCGFLLGAVLAFFAILKF